VTARIGIDLGGTKIAGIVFTPQHPEGFGKQRVPSPRHDYPATVAAVVDLVTRLEQLAGANPGSARVGIGTPGSLQPAVGRMKNCNSTWLNGQPLLADLEAALGPRVRIANDADCFALSEAIDGAATGAASAFGVILGTGVGGGLVLRGQLVQGDNGLTGEWGHVPLPYLRQRAFSAEPARADAERGLLESRLADRQCYCGRLNCIETFLCGPGLEATHAELWSARAAASAIARGDDPHAAQTFDLYRHMLARSLAQVVNLLDPAVIVLGGGLSNVEGLDVAQEALIPAYAFASPGASGEVRVAVRRARWGDDSGVRGAARLWQES
jgi:fructokinase